MGISTPMLHGVGRALLVEEYIAHDLLSAFANADDVTRLQLSRALGRTAGLLVNAGFAVLSTHDWRSHGDDVVLIDFGQDLGPEGITTGPEAGLLSELLDRIAASGIELTPDELRCVAAAYEASS